SMARPNSLLADLSASIPSLRTGTTRTGSGGVVILNVLGGSSYGVCVIRSHITATTALRSVSLKAFLKPKRRDRSIRKTLFSPTDKQIWRAVLAHGVSKFSRGPTSTVALESAKYDASR